MYILYTYIYSIFFSRLHVQSTRDGRSGKDSLFGRLESGAPFITPSLTVYVISLGERQNERGRTRGAGKKEIKRSGDGMTEFSRSSVGPSSFFRGRRNCCIGSSNNNWENGPSVLSLWLTAYVSFPLLIFLSQILCRFQSTAFLSLCLCQPLFLSPPPLPISLTI